MNKFITKTVCVLLLFLAVGMKSADAQIPEARTLVNVRFVNHAPTSITVTAISIDSIGQTQRRITPPLFPSWVISCSFKFPVATADITLMKVRVGEDPSSGSIRDVVTEFYKGYQPVINFT